MVFRWWERLTARSIRLPRGPDWIYGGPMQWMDDAGTPQATDRRW
jgi:hypothetical protein